MLTAPNMANAPRRIVVTLAVILFLGSFSINALEPDRCATNTAACLAEIDASLTQLKPASMSWFELKMHQFEVLFQLGLYDRLRTELDPWVDNPDAPVLFQARVTIYHAKLLLSPDPAQRGKMRAALHHAVELLLQANQVFPRPLYLVEIANLQLIYGQRQEAYDTLRIIEKRYQERGDPKFFAELYANLGHAAHSLNDLESAGQYREKSLEWSVKLGDRQQIAIALGNLARTRQLLKQDAQAVELYRRAVAAAFQAGDVNHQARLYVRLAQCLEALDRVGEARKVLSKIDEQRLSEEYLAILTVLRSAIPAS